MAAQPRKPSSKLAGKPGEKPRDKQVVLRKDLAQSLRLGHPWVYQQALHPHDYSVGEVVTVVDSKRRFVGRGIIDAGPIGVRVWLLKDRPLDSALLRSRLEAALRLRKRVIGSDTTAYRLLHGEGDRTPGLVVDVYGAFAVVRLDSDALEPLGEELGKLVCELCPEITHVLLKAGRGANKTVRALVNELPNQAVEVLEHGMKLRADLTQGQKTGLFLDHRESRRTVRRLSAGKRVLNLYGYTGGFSIAAGLGQAVRVDTVDVAEGALQLAQQAFTDNEVSVPHQTHASDVPEFLAESRGRWDLVVSDPPSFAPRESAVPKALVSYTKLHRACLAATSPGGIYLAASCSSHVNQSMFEETIVAAAKQSKQVLSVLGRWGAGMDHPRLLGFPEGDYLSVVLLRRLT